MSAQEKLEFWPGPMEGLSKSGFIKSVNALQLVRRWMTPFLRVSETPVSAKEIRKYVAPFAASGLPVVLQLMGHSPEKLAATAKNALGCGVAGINLNCGCPSKRVVRKTSGGGSLSDIENLRDIINFVKDSIGDLALSIKIRSGIDDYREMEEFLPRLLADGAVDKIFFHCRTVKEAYEPIADPESRFKLAGVLAGTTPLVINGDLDDSPRSFELIKISGAIGAMFARNWMRDPFLLRRLEKETAPEVEDGRKLFFANLQKNDLPTGNQIEIARMMWGEKSENFRVLLKNFREAGR